MRLQTQSDLLHLPPVDLYLIFEKSISTNWIFSLQKSISKLIFADYTGSNNQVRNRKKIHFVELDFSEIKVRLTGGCKGYDNTIKTRQVHFILHSDYSELSLFCARTKKSKTIYFSISQWVEKLSNVSFILYFLLLVFCILVTLVA